MREFKNDCARYPWLNRKRTAAISFVIQEEARGGRHATDTRHHKDAVPDVVSGDRLIEIKAAGASSRGNELWLEAPQYETAKAYPDRF